MDYEKYVQDRETIISGWVNRTLLTANGKGKTVAEIADKMGVSDSYLYKFSNPKQDKNLHVHNLPILLAESGDLSILDELEAMFGRIAIQVSGDPKELAANLRTLVLALESFNGDKK